MHWLPVYVWYAVGMTVGRKAYSQNLMQGLLVGNLKIDTVCVQVRAVYDAMKRDVRMKYFL